MSRVGASIGGIVLLVNVLATTAVATAAEVTPWKFMPAIDVTNKSGSGIYHHLESSGRRNIAVSDNYLAIVWEDNRSGSPQIYMAYKTRTAKTFTTEKKISSGGEAFEPSLVALDHDRFVIAWEQDSRIHMRLVSPARKQPGLDRDIAPITVVSPAGSNQASLAGDSGRLALVYSRKDGRRQRVWLQWLGVEGESLRKTQECAVDAEPAKEDQLYPTVIRVNDRTIVAWEDRRLGHTNIMGAQSRDASPCGFTSPHRITEAQPRMSATYGKGRGAARVALARYDTDRVLAVWADKRDFLEGYDVYAADYQADSKSGKLGLFGKNIKVQDDFGGVAHQWHPAVTNDGMGAPVVAWDDKREGNADIMLSWRTDAGWSDDVVVTGASGPGEQAHPAIVLDKDRNLHLVWVERSTIGSTTRLRYTFGRAVKPQ